MDSTRDDGAWRRIAVGSFGMLLCAAVFWNLAALFIEASGLRDSGPWIPVWAMSIYCTIVYGGPAILCSLAAMLIARYAGHRVARVCAWFSATVSVACAAALSQISGNISGAPADAAFAVAGTSLALVLLAPGILCIHQAMSERG